MNTALIPSSFAILNCMSTISIPKNAAFHRHANINGDGRSALTRRLGFQPSAMKVDDTSEVIRPHTVTFPPSVWGDLFSTFSFDDQVQQKYCEDIESLKKDARSMLMDATSSTKLLVLIDTLERLELAYHFETEIEDKLKQIYDSAEEEDNDLFTTALRFRLLRQHQYPVSCKVFDIFVDKKNKLRESFSSDVEGLLSLYEAAHVRIHNEKVLDEAVAFTTHHLSRMLPQLESPIKEKVEQALNYPLHRSISILTLRSHIDIYENDDSRDELLLRLAKFNFSYMQNIYKNEIAQLTKWWNKLDLKSKLPYCRDRLIECYVWGLSYHSEPDHYSQLRIFVTKIFLVFTVFDDTFDNYATLQEAQAFIQALERWNMEEIDELPESLKVVYKLIISFSEEVEVEAEKQGKTYIIPYYIETMKKTGRAYLRELEWFINRKDEQEQEQEQERLPSFEEYLIHSLTTTLVYSVSLVSATFLKSTTQQTIHWLLSDSQIFKAASAINRLLDDLATHQRESRDGTMDTCVEFYMKDRGVSMAEARYAFEEMVEDNWKQINEEWVDMICSSTSMELEKEAVVQFVNIARISEMTYKDGHDGFTLPHKNITPLVLALFQPTI